MADLQDKISESLFGFDYETLTTLQREHVDKILQTIREALLEALPEKKEADVPIAYDGANKISVNSQRTEGWNRALTKVTKIIKETLS